MLTVSPRSFSISSIALIKSKEMLEIRKSNVVNKDVLFDPSRKENEQ